MCMLQKMNRCRFMMAIYNLRREDGSHYRLPPGLGIFVNRNCSIISRPETLLKPPSSLSLSHTLYNRETTSFSCFLPTYISTTTVQQQQFSNYCCCCCCCCKKFLLFFFVAVIICNLYQLPKNNVVCVCLKLTSGSLSRLAYTRPCYIC